MSCAEWPASRRSPLVATELSDETSPPPASRRRHDGRSNLSSHLEVGLEIGDVIRPPTLTAVESTWDLLPVSAEVARAFARIVADLCSRQRRVPVLDALVAATAVVEGIPVVTQDRDYEAIPGVEVIVV